MIGMCYAKLYSCIHECIFKSQEERSGLNHAQLNDLPAVTSLHIEVKIARQVWPVAMLDKPAKYFLTVIKLLCSQPLVSIYINTVIHKRTQFVLNVKGSEGATIS
jgi:hypothetical protein